MSVTPHQYQDLIAIFESCFLTSHQTRLVRGDDEPIYLPKDKNNQHAQIVFAHGFYASALHEIAHWLVAGTERRKKEDYGYWYSPDGRDQQTQAEFEKVEIKPQAIEWALSIAAGFEFKVSCDNLNGSCEPDRHAFEEKIRTKLIELIQTNGFNDRTLTLLKALSSFYKTAFPISVAS
ncbi:elongation factor P hydroxylase [Catenovulum sp. SM1970]|uniref:elongation factor P hydroxylase n=1 Tax=Marinifaba aquimaris TaxID=2741323 RepID=UPI0015717B3E|nr:elongation factor P hydroxylase [Marinifaba aquimaris]NTS77974.1 elongation factor P hydroxylase [Marinifaba aquimaris]